MAVRKAYTVLTPGSHPQANNLPGLRMYINSGKEASEIRDYGLI